MDIDYSEVLNRIATTSYYDWFMFGITAANVIAFVVLTIFIYRLNYKVSRNQIKVQDAIAKNQDDLSKRNLKLQLFEKRYPLYETIVGTKTLLDLDNSKLYSALLALGNEKSNKTFIELNDNFLYQSLSSKFLYENDLVERINKIQNDFESVFEQYMRAFNRYNDVFSKGNVGGNIRHIVYAFSKQPKEDLLRNDLYIDIAVYKSEYDKYVKAVEESNVLEEFEKYLNIRDLEK